jgi:hypothetical protein
MKEIAFVVGMVLVLIAVFVFVIHGGIENSTRMDAKRAQDCVLFDKAVAHIATYDPADAIAIDKYRGNIC